MIYLTTSRARFNYANSHNVGGKSLKSLSVLFWFTSRMEFLRIETSCECGVIYAYRTRTTMSVESFPSDKPLSVAGWEYAYVWVKRPHGFQYGTWSFPRSRQKAHLKLYFFSFVKTHFYSPFHFLVKENKLEPRKVLTRCLTNIMFIFFPWWILMQYYSW